jgi:hypothetical protein
MLTFSLINYGFTTRASDVQMIGHAGTFSTPHGGDMVPPGRCASAIRCTLVRIFGEGWRREACTVADWPHRSPGRAHTTAALASPLRVAVD